MRNRFDDMLDNLNVELIKLGSLCEESIGNAIRSVVEQEDCYAKAVSLETEIDEKEHEIETMCMRLLLMQQPVAADLREVSAALKMISDMERIGDQALDIVEMSKYLTKGQTRLDDLEQMAKATSTMVTESIDSFVKHDLELARTVEAQDDIVDELFDKVKKDIIEMIGNNRADGEYLTDVLMVAKYFERIADHATNIVEWVAYAITGVHQKIQ